jgi:hypothetical protein
MKPGLQFATVVAFWRAARSAGSGAGADPPSLVLALKKGATPCWAAMVKPPPPSRVKPPSPKPGRAGVGDLLAVGHSPGMYSRLGWRGSGVADDDEVGVSEGNVQCDGI